MQAPDRAAARRTVTAVTRPRRPPRAGGRGRCRGTPPPDRRGRSGRAGPPGCRDRRSRPCFIISTWSHRRSTSRHVVGGEQDRAAALGAVAFEPGAHQVAGVGVEARGRLVEQQQSGRLISDLASATRVFCPAESCPAGPVQQVRQVEFARPAPRCAAPAAARRRDGHRRAGSRPRSAGAAARRRATRNSSGRARRSGRCAMSWPSTRMRPGGRDQQAEQHGDGRGLAGAVAAEQPDGLRRPARRSRCRPPPASSP